MDISFDPAKRAKTLEQRGLDFADAGKVFEGRTITILGTPMTKKSEHGSEPWVDPDDAPELTEEMLDDAEYFVGNTFIKRGRGRPPTGNAKEQVSIRLDQDVLRILRQAGPGWQATVNGILRQALGVDAKPATTETRVPKPAPPKRRVGPSQKPALSR